MLYTVFPIRYTVSSFYGAVAQLVEHHVRNVGVESSSLFRSTSLYGLVFFMA